MTNSDHDKTLRKFRRERAVGRLLNPAVKGLSKLGLRTAMATELETVGRKRPATAVPFRCNRPDGAWVIGQHGPAPGGAVTLSTTPMFVCDKEISGVPE